LSAMTQFGGDNRRGNKKDSKSAEFPN